MNAPGPTVAVLGATGWVGRHVCEAFTHRGHRVLALARGPSPSTAHDRFHRVDVSTACPRALSRLFREEGVATVINATDAANARDGWQLSDEQVRDTNVTAVRTLLRAAAESQLRTRFLHLGTLLEYGPIPRGTAVTEDTVPRPSNSYARSKLAGSQSVIQAARDGGIEGTVLRLANACGPHPSPVSFPGVLLRRFHAAVEQRHSPALHIAEAQRDFVDVRDIAEAVVAAALVRASPAPVLNIGGGRAVPIREMVTLAAEAAGLGADSVQELPPPPKGLGGDWSLADIRLAQDTLDWRPRIPMDESLKAMWAARMD